MGMRSVHPVLGISSDPVVLQGGFRTPLPTFNAGGVPAVAQAGFRTVLPTFPAGGESGAPVVQGGFRSLMGFWIGGATSEPEIIGGRPPAGRVRKKVTPEFVLPWITEEVAPEDKKALVSVLSNVDTAKTLRDYEALLKALDEFIDKYLELHQLRTQLIVVKQELEEVVKVRRLQVKNQQRALLLLRRL